MPDSTQHPEPDVHRPQGVSIQIRHQVRAGAADRYETWLKQIIETAARFPGHQGVHVFRPAPGHQDYEISVRFSSESDAQYWRNSDERRELMAVILPELQTDEHVEIKTGIDFWFTPPTSTSKQPTRWKQWLITTMVIWPLTVVVPLLLSPLFNALPALDNWGIRHGLVVATVVALVVYLIMPRVVRLVASWLFR